MASPFFRYQHPVDGALTFTYSGGEVNVACRWPFDRQLDDWIEISNTFAVERYRAAVHDLMTGGGGRVDGINGGFLSFANAEEGIALECTNSASGSECRS